MWNYLFVKSYTKIWKIRWINIWLSATNAYQNILTLGETYGYLSGLAADVHQLRIPDWNSLSQEENWVLVLLLTHPEGKPRKDISSSYNIIYKCKFISVIPNLNLNWLQLNEHAIFVTAYRKYFQFMSAIKWLFRIIVPIHGICETFRNKAFYGSLSATSEWRSSYARQQLHCQVKVLCLWIVCCVHSLIWCGHSLSSIVDCAYIVQISGSKHEKTMRLFPPFCRTQDRTMSRKVFMLK